MFMEKEITPNIKWWMADTDYGVFYYPADEFSREAVESMHAEELEELEELEGFGARLSAPGFLDCTEWSVHESEEAAEEFLQETYYDWDDGEVETRPNPCAGCPADGHKAICGETLLAGNCQRP